VEDYGKWDHYVYSVCPKTGIQETLRCLGMQTAEHIAEMKRRRGFVKVRIGHRRFGRHKEQQSHVYHGSIHG
jgi:hypothetical protein